MTKDELVQQIANRRTQIAEIEVEIENLRGELGKVMDWQIGDVVEMSDGNIFKLATAPFDDYGSQPFHLFRGYKPLPGRVGWTFTSHYIGQPAKLIERQP